MATKITVPRLGWTMEEGVFLGWLKNDGDSVRDGDAIFTLESDKSAQEVEATGSGILRISPHAPAPGATVRVGALLGYVAAEGESVAFENESGVAGRKSVTAQQFSGQSPARPAAAIPPDALTISPRAARTAAALGVDWTKVRGTGRTGRVRERDILAAAFRL
jgi:pyruvate dehydrogenase E2 component (dihydrolipoamide acetyltransferase)